MKPSPEAKEVLIKVKATSVTAADCMMRRGDTLLSRILLGYSRPKEKFQILGTEFSGVIESIGPKVKKFGIGDEIFAFRGFGTGCYAFHSGFTQPIYPQIKPDRKKSDAINKALSEMVNLVKCPE